MPQRDDSNVMPLLTQGYQTVMDDVGKIVPYKKEEYLKYKATTQKIGAYSGRGILC